MTMMIMTQIKVMTMMIMMARRIVMTMMIIRQMNYDDHNDHGTEESEEHHCLIPCVHAGSRHHHWSLANSS